MAEEKRTSKYKKTAAKPKIQHGRIVSRAARLAIEKAEDAQAVVTAADIPTPPGTRIYRNLSGMKGLTILTKMVLARGMREMAMLGFVPAENGEDIIEQPEVPMTEERRAEAVATVNLLSARLAPNIKMIIGESGGTGASARELLLINSAERRIRAWEEERRILDEQRRAEQPDALPAGDTRRTAGTSGVHAQGEPGAVGAVQESGEVSPEVGD